MLFTCGGQVLVQDVTPDACREQGQQQWFSALSAACMSASETRRISRAQFAGVLSRQLKLGSTSLETAEASSFPTVLARRYSYRGPLAPLADEDMMAMLDLCHQSSTYRPFGVPGGLKTVSLIFGSHALRITHLGDEPALLSEVVDHQGLKNFLEMSFTHRGEIPQGVPSYIAVGIDAGPLVTKYGTLAVGLILTTTGVVLELLELVAHYLNLRSCILFGAREARLWALGDWSQVVIPAAVRIGRPL